MNTNQNYAGSIPVSCIMKIAVPKGRIMELFLKHLKKKKIYITNYNTREMIMKTNIKNLKIIPIKYLDSYFYLKKKYVDCCLSGNDIYSEFFHKKKKIIKKKINIFCCKLSLITRNDYNSIKKFYKKKKILIYTKYKNIAKRFFLNKKYKIKKLNGALELSLCLKISDFIVDIIDTGRTVYENNLVSIKKIKNIYSVILLNKKISLKKMKFLKIIFDF